MEQAPPAQSNSREVICEAVTKQALLPRPPQSTQGSDTHTAWSERARKPRKRVAGPQRDSHLGLSWFLLPRRGMKTLGKLGPSWPTWKPGKRPRLCPKQQNGGADAAGFPGTSGRPVRHEKGAQLMDYVSSRRTEARALSSGGSTLDNQSLVRSLQQDLEDDQESLGAPAGTSPAAPGESVCPTEHTRFAGSMGREGR